MSIKNKINKRLPKEQRLGQIGMSNTYGEMKIVGYRNTTDIDVYFKDYNQTVKHRRYDRFLEGELKPDLKLAREGQIRKATNGQWMRLLKYNNSHHCIVEFEDGTLVDCGFKNFNNGTVLNPNYVKPSENEFYYNDKLECWVGVTKKGEEFLFSHPDEKVIKYVKSCTWYIKTNTYVHHTSTDKRLHHIILPLTKETKKQGFDRIDHINNDPLDNRYENLRYSNAKENARNRKSIGKSGITGLRYQKNRKTWYGCCFYNNAIICTKNNKDKNEALIDLLIMQRLLNYTHNEHLFYLLDDIPQERIDFVENYIKEKIEKKKNIEYTVTCHNTFEKIDDGTYKMYDSKDRSCLIDAEDVEKIKLGNWNLCNMRDSKKYFKGRIDKNTALHRYILNVTNSEYSDYMIDHLDGNSLNNKKENLIITDVVGNNINIFGKGYYIQDDKYVSNIKRMQSCSFDTKQEAINFYNHYKQILMDGRLQWKTKEELDKWLENIKQQRLEVNEVIKAHYEKLYKYVGELIEEFECNRSSSFLM